MRMSSSCLFPLVLHTHLLIRYSSQPIQPTTNNKHRQSNKLTNPFYITSLVFYKNDYDMLMESNANVQIIQLVKRGEKLRETPTRLIVKGANYVYNIIM